MCSLLAQNNNSRSKSRKTIIIKSISRDIFQKLQNYLILLLNDLTPVPVMKLYGCDKKVLCQK